ncbi:MAG: response regulator [Betaproteobacteria bacterium]|nr:response regulator [Betaproteobacteria bacterium]
MFTDVIRTAENEHEICFLLTSYAEAVRYDRSIDPLPEPITRLPVRGLPDVRERFDQLMPELDAASKRLDNKAVALIKQALHTYGTALGRLQALEKERAEPAQATAAPQAGRGPLDILLVEDNPADVRMTREALAVAGVPHELHVVEDGVDALSYLCQTIQFNQATKPDVVLLDLNIPRLGGHEVLIEIKRRDELKHIPVVVLTSSRADQDMLKSFGMQADRYVTKPAGLQAFVWEMKKLEQLAAAHP